MASIIARCVGGGIILSCALFAPVRAQGTASAQLNGPWVRARESMQAPMRRAIAVKLDRVSMRDALREIAREGNVEIGYGEDVLSMKTRVTLRLENRTVAEALDNVLEGTGLEAYVSLHGDVVLVRRAASVRKELDEQKGVITGHVTDVNTHTPIQGVSVILEGTKHSAVTSEDGMYRIADVAAGSYTLAARRIGYSQVTRPIAVAENEQVTADVTLEAAAGKLDQVVVTGTVAPTEVKALPTPITIITADQIAKQNIRHVDELFRGDVPGLFTWDLGTQGYYSSFATTRGASTLNGFNGMKVYVDGIEMADETFLTDIDATSIERIEIIRGPQASTIYGSQALNGVIQIFTKKGKLGLTRPQVEGSATVGLVQSAYVDNNPSTQQYTLQVRGASEHASYNLGGGYQSVGAFAPGGSDHSSSAYGGAHLETGALAVELSARYVQRPFVVAIDPLYPDAYPQQKGFTDINRQQMLAGTATYQLTSNWTHSLTAGIDHESYDDYIDQRQLTTPADTFFNVSSGAATRLSVSYHTTLTARLNDAISTTWTGGIDHWESNQNSFYATETSSLTGVLGTPPDAFVLLSRYLSSDDGYYAQLQTSFDDDVFLTAGVRGSKSSSVGSSVGTVWAPRVGISVVHKWGETSLKARASYGKGIRQPIPAYSEQYVSPGQIHLANPDLRPEQQTGFDGGLELYVGSRASLQATYYKQRATDLIAYEVLSFDPETFITTAQHVNLSKVKNDGWELQGTLTLIPSLTLTGTYTITNSVILDPGVGYAGDYQAGDRLLLVPKNTAGATLTFTTARTTLSTGMSYGSNWVNTDTRRLYDDYANGIYTNPMRSYWISYPAFARFRASVSQQLTPRIQGLVQVDNLTNKQTGQIDNISLTAGRTTTLGFRFIY